MPSGKVHTTATVAGSITTAIAMAYYGFPTSEVVGAFAGFMTTLVINPDLDLNTRRPKEFLPLLWWIFWYPYSRAVKHRSPLSHFPIVGTFFRVAYAGFFILLLAFLLTIENNPERYYYFLAGMVISDAVHFLMDITTTKVRRLI